MVTVVHDPTAPENKKHYCFDVLDAQFPKHQLRGVDVPYGTIVECDCGLFYKRDMALPRNRGGHSPITYEWKRITRWSMDWDKVKAFKKAKKKAEKDAKLDTVPWSSNPSVNKPPSCYGSPSRNRNLPPLHGGYRAHITDYELPPDYDPPVDPPPGCEDGGRPDWIVMTEEKNLRPWGNPGQGTKPGKCED